MQLLLFGFALDSTVSHLRLGVIDWSNTPESRELISTITESKSFQPGGYYASRRHAGSAISRGKLDAGIVVPYEFARDLHRGTPVDVQILLNAVNANTATIAQGYAEGVILSYNQTLAGRGYPAQDLAPSSSAPPGRRGISADGDRVPLQSRPGERLVHRHRHIRRIADPERIAASGHRHGEGARARHRGAIADDSRQHYRYRDRQDCSAVRAADGDGYVRDRVMRLFFEVPVRGSLMLVALSAAPMHPLRHRHRHFRRDVHQVGAASA